MTTLLCRLHALVLLVLFLGGGSSLPAVDVLLFHRHGEPSQTAAHVETSKGCPNHISHCGIGCPASESRALGAQVVTPLLDAAPSPIALQPATRFPSFDTCGIGFYSRAPPSVG